MADNVTANPGAGGATFASDDIGGVQYPRIKLTIGADGVTDGDLVGGAGATTATTVRVVEATDSALTVAAQNIDTDLGARADTVATSDTGTFSLVSLTKRLLTKTSDQSAASLSGLESGSLVRQVPAAVYRCSFAAVGSGLVTTDLVQIGSTGTGITVSQSAGNLVIAAGTTANAEFLARSVFTVKGAHAMRFGTVLSQRIANNNFHVCLADLIGAGLTYTIISATQVDVTLTAHGFTAQNVGQFMFLGAISGAAGIPGRFAIASIPDANTIRFTVASWPATGTGTLCLFGWNYHQVLFDGTTATNAKYDAQRKGWASGDTTVTINTTASPGTICHIQSDGSDTSMADSLRASSTGYQFSTRGSRIENIPDLDTSLYLFVWCRNGTTNPASSTTWTINFVSVEDLENIKVGISGATRNGFGNALPMAIQGTPNVAISSGNVGNNAGTNLMGDVGQQYRANATGAATPFSLLSPATPAASAVKASGGRLIGFVLNNSSASVRSVKFWNTAAGSVTLGTTAALFEIDLQPSQTLAIEYEGGIAFGTAITAAVTGAKGLTDNTAITLNDVSGVIIYA